VAAEAGIGRPGGRAAAPAEVRVVAGALFDGARRVLIAQRPPGKHMAGRWELPGGKLHAGETAIEALRRELAEELGVELRDARPLIRLRHDYADRRIVLDVWRVTDFAGEPRGLDGQALEWVQPDELPRRDLLEADLPIVTALRLPCTARAAIGASALEDAARAVREPTTLFWAPQPAGAVDDAARDAVRAARAAGHRVLVAGEEVAAAIVAAATGADGVLLEWRQQELDVDSRGVVLVGVRCESAPAALAAARAGAQFVLLAPPAGPPAGEVLARLCEQAGVPVLAGWYPAPDVLAPVRSAGAHGCAVGAPLPPLGDTEA
jgi:8-oxo-dGTP diphosphatase